MNIPWKRLRKHVKKRITSERADARAGALVCRDADVREFLPTLVQAGYQGT
jgi:hypothetical protein